jgi:ABC-type Fe3+/spermidine/putrescine transport system ATPase subunit
MLTVDALTKTYQSSTGPVMAARGLSFTLQPGEILSLVGPSGCGKTTALRCVAGLETPDSGRIEMDGQVVFDSDQGITRPPHLRSAGMVFQSYAIWPHMTVFENVAYPLRAQRPRLGRAEIAQRVAEALDMVQMPGYGDRQATMLSGGQQQRVAIARALVRGASVLLFDEPLSNLDATLREEMRAELRALFERTEVSVLYVTHDLGEALALSDRLIVLSAGRIEQVGTPEEIYCSPTSVFVARFLGNAALLPGRTAGRGVVHSELGAIQLGPDHVTDGSDQVTVVVRPEAVQVDADGPSRAVVEAGLYLGSHVEYRLVTSSGLRLAARSPAGAPRHQAGEEVGIRLDPSGVAVVPTAEGVAADAPAVRIPVDRTPVGA